MKKGSAYDPEIGAFQPSNYVHDMEKAVRMGFIRKVYGLLTAQLLMTIGICYIFVQSEDVKMYVQQNSYLIWVAIGLTFTTIIALSCCPGLSRSHPTNIILLFFFTACESFLVGVISSSYDTQAVFLALIITTVTVVALTLFACQTKIDFTKMNGMLFAALWVLIMFGFLRLFFPTTAFIETVYAGCGAGIFAMFIVYDTCLIMGGNHKYTISVDEYVFAALNLYLDVINLFLYILALVGGGRGRRN